MNQNCFRAAALLIGASWELCAYAAATTAPVVQPLPAYSTQASIAIRGQAQPAVHVFVDGGMQRVHGVSAADGAFDISVPLKRNQHNSLSVFASTDAQGEEHNSARVHLSIVEDDIAPLISATLDPAPNAAGWHRRPVKVEFHCSDRGSGVSECPDEVRVSTPGAQQTISAVVTDKAGNSASVSVVVNLDDSAPAVLLDAPADGTLFYNSPVHLSGTLAESLSGVAAVNCNNVPAIVAGNSFSCDVPLKDGNNAIKVWAVDAAGNLGVARKSLVLGPALPGGDAHQTMVSGHVNQHVNADVVHTDFLTREVSILFGNGDGTFQPERRVLVGPYPSAVALADLNGDGIADLITTHYTTGEVAIQYGRADGGFTPGPRFAVDAFPSALIVADINGDGRLDLLTAHMLNHQVHLHLGQRDGSFKEQRNFAVGEGPVAIAVGDLDGDGKLDIVTANFTSGDVSLLLGKGKGKFHDEQRLALSTPSAKRTAAALSANPAPSAIAIADVNGDTFADIVTTDYGSNSISLLLGAGQGRFQPVQTLAVGQQPVALAIADVTGDGKLDLISANLGSSDLSVLCGLGAAGFASEQRISTESAPASLSVLQVNGGQPILVSAGSSIAVQVVAGDGSGGFASVFSVAEAMNAPYAVYLPLVVGASAFDGVHHTALHLLNATQADNDVAITFVDELTGLGVAQYRGALPPAGSALLPTVQSRPEGFTGTPPASGFQGAVVVSSKRPVSAFAELLTLSGSRDAYDGIQRGGGSHRILLPFIAKNVIGFNGTIVVQNVGLQPATVHVEYTPGRRGVPGSTAPVTLRPGQSHTFRAAEASIEDTTGQFFGSASVLGNTAGDRLAVVAIHESRPPLGSESVNVYNGVGDDLRSDTLYVPLHMAWHDRNSLTDIYFTTLAITNTGDEDTEVHVTTSRNVALPEQSAKPVCSPGGHFVPDTFPVAAGKTRQLGFSNSCKYVGSAVLTSTTGQPLAAVVIQSNVSRSAMYTAIPKSEASEEVLLPQIVSQYTAGARYSEIQIQNVDATATQVSIAFAPNQLGGSRPPDLLRQLDPAQTLYIGDLAHSGIEYLGSATVTTDNHVKLAVVVTELPRDPIEVADPIQTYVGHAPPKSKIGMDIVRVPDTPLINPCLPFLEKVRSVRDSPGGTSVYIDPPTINPLFGFINCFQTEDEEHQQRAQAQGLLLTRELPLFARMDPVIGPLPGLLINTDPLWAAHSSSDNTSIAVIGTSASSTKSRLVMSDPWAQFAAALAQTMATAAAAALGQGAGDAMVNHLRQFDWLSGPADLTPSGLSPLDQRDNLKRRLIGLGAVSDNGEEAHVNRLISSALNSAEATTGNPGPGPDFPCDVANEAGFITAEILGIASDFHAFDVVYSELNSVSRGFLIFRDVQPKHEGALNLCKVMRTFAACMRARNLTEMEIAERDGALPQQAKDFLNRYWADGHLTNPATGGEKWIINVHDRNHPGFSCLFE